MRHMKSTLFNFTALSAQDAEQRPQTPVMRTAAPRGEPAFTLSKADRVRRTIEAIALWFGLLFSAALLGTFLVVGVVLSYALIMTLTGH